MKAAFLERFMRYIAVTSQSKVGAGKVPSTEGQRELAKLLQSELEAMGFVDLHLSEFSVLTGRLPSNLPAGTEAPVIGWCVHLDTVDVGMSPEIHPQVIKAYAGGDICLNADKDLWFRVAEHPEIERYIGDDIVVSDGTSVLGADDKSAIANVMTVFADVVEKNLPHGDIYIAFVPDEEIGLVGAKHMDLKRFPVDFAYTIDCCELGECVWQTFNAGKAQLTIEGKTAHPMSAKGVLVNPTLIAVDFVNMLNRAETPECTEGTEGFIWVNGIQSKPSNAIVTAKIRDHNLAGYNAKKAKVRAAVDYLRIRYPQVKIELDLQDTYGNIADAMTDDNRQALDNLLRAFALSDVEVKAIAMRGGTDGSYISTQGIFTPNYFTGAHNFHSPFEFLPLASAQKSMAVTKALIDLAAGTVK